MKHKLTTRHSSIKLPLLSSGVLLLLLCAMQSTAQTKKSDTETIIFPKTVAVREMSPALLYCTTTIPPSNTTHTVIDLPVLIKQPNAAVVNELKEQFHWLPNIKSGPNQVVAQHVFRSPCIIQTLQKKSIALIPDIRVLADNQQIPHYLDLEYTGNKIILHYGVAKTKVAGHVYYEKTDEPFTLKQPLQLAFYVLIKPTTNTGEILKATTAFVWDTFAVPYTKSPLPQVMPFARYADTGYAMALQQYWVDVTDTTGGITLSTFKHEDGSYGGRSYKNDLWYQSWFNNVRTAYGLYQWGKQQNNNHWQQRAQKMVRLLMTAPNNQGWFKTIYVSEEKRWEASGLAKDKAYHVPDNCWTALWLLRFSKDCASVPQADSWLLSLAEALLKVQNEDGGFPALVRADSLTALPALNHTASSAMATWYLEELLLANKIPEAQIKQYQTTIQRSLLFLQKHVLTQQRFEDFENYYSCSPKPVGYFDTATTMYSQNTLSIAVVSALPVPQ